MHLEHLRREASAVCRQGRAAPFPPAPDAPPSSAGYAPSDMPVKAKRSTYNYSLPITVKKTRTRLGPRRGPRASGLREGGPLPRGPPGPCWPACPWRGWGGVLGGTPVFRGTALSRTASQLVSMHDLTQGLGPPGTAGTRKSASNKYKLKVGVPGVPGEQPPTGLRGAWGWCTHCTLGAPCL